MIMSKYKYDDFVANKDLIRFITESAQIIENAGYDPSLFYETIANHPEVLLMEDEKSFNELMGWLPDAAKAGWNAVKNIGSGRRAKQQTGQLDYIKSLSPDQKAAIGITPEKEAELEKQQQAAVGSAQKGFGQNLSQGWQDARTQRTVGNIQKQLGIGKYAPPKPYAAPGTQATPTAPQAPQSPTPAPQQTQQPQQPTPQPQSPLPQPVAFNAQQVIAALQGALTGNRGGRVNTKQLIPKMQALLQQLQAVHP